MAVTRIVLAGNERLAGMYIGAATNFLFILKNRMSTGGIQSLSSYHYLPDGTAIEVNSIFGSDEIKITSPFPPSVVSVEGISRAVVLPESCRVIIIGAPSIVQPMKLPGIIGPKEIQGRDYLKTYYRANIADCPNCKTINWRISFEYITKRSDIPSSDYVNPKTGKKDPNNHLIQTLFPPGWGQVLRQGNDPTGSYIIWKVFTEGSLKNLQSEFPAPLSATGLGWVQLVLSAVNTGGKPVCSSSAIIKVDCCLKSGEERIVQVWDESTVFGGPRPMIFFEGDVYYLTPGELDWYSLCYYAIWGSGAFFLFPEVQGACTPYTWTLSGPGALGLHGEKTIVGESISFIPPDNWPTIDCHESVMINVADRCGTQASFKTTDCCSGGGTPIIIYTTLIMGCNAQQTFEAWGGCPPYQWSVNFGSIVPETLGSPYATYTSPATNANCTSNPTITCTDCCGQSATLKLAINCYAIEAEALKLCTWQETSPPCTCLNCYNNTCSQQKFGAHYRSEYWDCNGISYGTPCVLDDVYIGNNQMGTGEDCISYPNCNQSQMPKVCTTDICQVLIDTTTNCIWGPSCTDCYGYKCNTLYDIRSPVHKAGGCCPINPLTGLPYD